MGLIGCKRLSKLSPTLFWILLLHYILNSSLTNSCYLFPADKPDPCKNHACLFGSVCVASKDGLYATCECPTSCPSYGDSEDSQYVCGTDGRGYKNKCELDKQSCAQRRNVSVAYTGKCDPCEDIQCSPPQVCHLDEDRRPTCRCSELCSMEFHPVCSSNGKTFQNECVMRQEACRTRKDLRIIYRGKCSSGVNPCESRVCRGYESCLINRFGIAQCTCDMVCEAVIKPVCGSDKRTYENQCQLELISCREAKHITVAHKGTCESGNICANKRCPHGATCSEKNGDAICECPNCPSEYDPICGEDGVSYQNECRLKLESCLTNKEIKSLYTGLCNGCESKQCDFYSTCVSDFNGAQCNCPQNCTEEYTSTGTVCGTDMIEYSSECELRKASCRLQKFIVVASKGPCQNVPDLCSNVQCKFGARCEAGNCVCPQNCPLNRELVCGSDLVTYSNECELQKAACILSRTLTVHFYGDCNEGLLPGLPGVTTGFGYSPAPNFGTYGFGHTPPLGNSYSPPVPAAPDEGLSGPKLCEDIRCEFGAICEIGQDSFPRCTCLLNCSSSSSYDSSPICASDLKMYRSECEMKREACHRQTELRPRPKELCEDMVVEPCNGDEPLKNLETGEDINCGSGPDRQNCQQGWFCHHSPTFAKCCKLRPEKTTVGPPIQGKCKQSSWGCCEDGKQEALGPDMGGCPSKCMCNKLGSISETCDPITGECRCRHGVAGSKCNFCISGFWGLTRAPMDGHKGCRACECSKFGSVRDDCEQMSGRCVCKPGVLGSKCDKCPEGEFLGPLGCTSDPINLGQSCEEIVCNYGAECEQDGNRAGCVCNFNCDDSEKEEVCANDGFTYENPCTVRLQACRNQKAIWISHKGPCNHDEFGYGGGTEIPIRRWTGAFAQPYTDPGGESDDGWRDAGESSGMKSTRHLPLPVYNFHKNFYSHRSPTSATIQRRSYLGDFCQSNSDCITSHSLCLSGWCICKEGYYEDSDRIQCVKIHSHLSNEQICGGDGFLSEDFPSQLCDFPTTCFDHRNGTHSCLCPLSKSNSINGCIHRETPFPFFGGRSMMRIGKLAGYHKLSIELEITPMIDFGHGILIFSSQHANGSGDFLSIALIDGFVEFRYDLGDGSASLKSPSRLLSGISYHIVAKRYNRDGLLRVDEEEAVKGFSPGSMRSLNLDHGGFIGYVPLNSTKIWETVGTSEGFIGCIHKLKVGRRLIEFDEGRDPLIASMTKIFQCPVMSSFHRLTTTSMYVNSYDQEIEEEKSYSGLGGGGSSSFNSISISNNFGSPSLPPWDTNPCDKNPSPCLNNGQCWGDKGSSLGYQCVCHPSYTGVNCETRSLTIVETGAMIDFRGFSYLEMPKIENAGRVVSIELWVMARERNGLILYNGQEFGKGDFLAVTLQNGHLQFLFDLGSGIANLTWPQPLQLNKWVWISAKRNGREGKLQIDGEVPLQIRSPPMLSELNLEQPLYIGSIRDMNMLHRELGIIPPFDGVLQYVKINGETYYREISSALRERLVHRYEGPPCGSSVSPCHHNGSCYPRLESFVCVCPPNFSGKTCETRNDVPAPGPIRFNGQNFLRFPRKEVGKHESFNFSNYDDDFYNEHFDSQLDELFFKEEEEDDDLEENPYGGEEGEEGEELMPIEGQEIEGLGDFEEDFMDLDDELNKVEGEGSDDEFIPLVENESESDESKTKAHRRNRIEIVFRTNSDNSGVILWTGTNPHMHKKKKRKGYLGLFLVEGGFLELRVELGAGRKKQPVTIRSKVKVNDGRWHQILIARRRRLVVLQVDGFQPSRGTSPMGSRVLLTDGRYFIGGIETGVLPNEIPPDYHSGFIGCVDLVRIEKRRLPLTKIAYNNGIPFCEDN